MAQHLSNLLTAHFLLLWLASLIAISVCGLVASVPGHPLFSRTSLGGTSDGKTRPNFIDSIAAIILALLVVCYVVAIFYREDFNYYDDDLLTDFSLLGRSFPAPIWPDLGRFFPLELQEFNVLGRITRSPVAFHSFAAAQVIILILALIVTLNAYRFVYRALILMMLMLAPSFVTSFTSLIYPERNLVFWLGIMLFCLHGYSKTKASIYFVGCLVATHFALYYKEPFVILVVAYAIASLLLAAHIGQRAGRSWAELIRENYLSLGLLGVAAIYTGLYLVIMMPHSTHSYIAAHHDSLTPVLLAYAQTDWLPFLLLAIVIIRLWRFTVSDAELDLLWDPLAVGALGYFFVVLAVRMVGGYFLAPVDLITVLYAAWVAQAWLSRPIIARWIVVATAFACILVHNIAYSSFRIIERKNMIITKTELATFLQGYLRTTNTKAVELFFPYASDFHLMEFSTYLRYKGFHLAGQSSTSPSLVIAGRDSFPNHRCVAYRADACVHEDKAPAGALIIILPDDDASMNDVENAANESALIFSMEAPRICEKQWFRSLHAIAPEFSVSQLPEHWLQLHVFRSPSVAAD